MNHSIPDLPYGSEYFIAQKRFDENENIKTIIFTYNNETDAITCQKCFDLFYDTKCQSFFINENNFENYFLYENTKPENQRSVLFCKKEFLKEKIINPTSIQTKIFKKGDDFNIEDIEPILIKNGYQRVTEVFCKNEYAIKGGIIEIYQKTIDSCISIELSFNTIEQIRQFNPMDRNDFKKINSFKITQTCGKKDFTIEKIKNSDTFFINDRDHTIYQHDIQYDYTDIKNIENENTKSQKIVLCSSDYAKDKIINAFIAKQICFKDNTKINLHDRSDYQIINSKINAKIHFKINNTTFVSYIKGVQTKKQINIENILKQFSQIKPNDYIIHKNYGIGQFLKIKTIDIDKKQCELLEILYAHNDRLLLPIENINLISKYRSDNYKIDLDSLRSKTWTLKKKKAKAKIMQIADKLITNAAIRQKITLEKFLKDSRYEEFCENFEHIETEDQLKSIDSIIDDLKSGNITERIICADTGFGKTEVIIRAAYIVAANNQNVIITVPTTILCNQHYKYFTKRFQDFNINVYQCSKIIDNIDKTQIKNGGNIIIATHKILYAKIDHTKTKMVIIDEEHHFGVTQKEKLKTFSPKCHLLLVSATPIPRTLQMGLNDITKISFINTPPIAKTPPMTQISILNFDLMKETIEFELKRGGQIFIVVPFIKHIIEITKQLSNMGFENKYKIAHGKFTPSELSKIMDDFAQNKIKILLSTSIIESGTNILNANTIIVINSEQFGLSQLYQLRGRVGRGDKTGRALFLHSENITQESLKRLHILKSLSTLGDGFKIANYDMENRGYGNLLGKEQSGHIKEIGMTLYNEMLQSALMKITIYDKPPEIKIGQEAKITKEYIKDDNIRMHYYKRICDLYKTEDENTIKQEIEIRYGKIPQETFNLFEITNIQKQCIKKGISQIIKNKNFMLFKFYENNLNADINEIIQKGFILNTENSLKYPILKTDNIFTFLLGAISKI